MVVGIDFMSLVKENMPNDAEEEPREKSVRCTELPDALPDRGTNKKE